ncbi:MAG: STAS/SEC14 domain-containing protein [Methylovulum miyakonense]|uniref:STAS/SEC14 domain-containing protein n=1 Tax=Methylovulum miyakonense TaxID=645578 RepID=UPI003BB5685E
MLHIELDKTKGIATLKLVGVLSKQDIESVKRVIDPYIDKSGCIKGVIINTETFPGWESFGLLIKHFKFTKDRPQKVSHIAVMADSVFGDFAENVASHFFVAKIKHFAFDELQKAQNWILNTKS